MLRRPLHSFIVLGLLASPGFLFAAPVPSDDKKAESPAEKTRKALDKAGDIDYGEMALAAAVTKLREDYKLNFVLDQTTIMNFVGDPNTLTVKASQKNTKLKTALRQMLSPYHMSYAIVGDSIIITTEDMAMQRQMRQRVSLDLDAVPFADAMKQLSRETATNVLVDAKVKKDAESTVTLQLEDVPLETAIRLLSEAVGLKPVRMGNVLYITSKANATELRGDPDLITGQPTGPGVPVPTYPPPPIGAPGGIGVPPAPPAPSTVPEVPPTPKERDKGDKSE